MSGYPLGVSIDLGEKRAQDHTQHHSLDPEEMRHPSMETVRSPQVGATKGVPGPNGESVPRPKRASTCV